MRYLFAALAVSCLLSSAGFAQQPLPPVPTPDSSQVSIATMFNALSQQLAQSVDNYRRVYEENQTLKAQLQKAEKPADNPAAKTEPAK